MPRRTLGMGSAALDVSALGLGCMGMSEFYGHGDEDESIATIQAFSTPAEACSTPRTCTARSPTKSWWAGPSQAGATTSSWPPSSATNGGPTDPGWASTAPPTTCAPLATQPAAAGRGPHRPVLPAPGGQDRPDRGNRRGHGGAGPGRQGPAPWPVRGQRRHRAPGPRGAPHHRPADRILAVGARPGDQGLPGLAELGIGFVPYSPLGRGIPDRPCPPRGLAEDDFRAPPRASRARTSTPTCTLVDRVRARRRKGCTPGQLALAWLLAQGRASFPSPAPSGASTSRRTRPRPTSSSARRTWHESTPQFRPMQ